MTIQLMFVEKYRTPAETDSVTAWIRDTEYPAALISYLYRTLLKRMTKELAPYHIGIGHFMILMSLYEQEGRNQDELAQSKGFDKTMIAKSVVKLEAEAFITRVIDTDDNRVKRLYLTKKGRSIQEDLEEIAYRVNGLLLKDLDNTESDTVIAWLQKIALNASKI